MSLAQIFALDRRIASGNHCTAQNDEPEPSHLRLVTNPKAAWMAVGAAWQRQDSACESCRFVDRHSQVVGFDEGQATQNTVSCGLRAPHSPLACPALLCDMECDGVGESDE